MGYTRATTVNTACIQQESGMNSDIAAKALRPCIQKVATGPEYSKNLGYDEAYAGMNAILSGEADPVQAAVMLIGLRMKRETEEENAAALQAVIDNSQHLQVDVDHLVDVAEPYGGQIKNLPTGPFLPAVLAACGVPAYSHGMVTVGPKFGATTHTILKAAGVDVSISLEEAAARIANPDIGWAYVDQSVYAPGLNQLIDLRNRMVKRNVLTTVEVLGKALSGRKATTLVTGYVHVAYPPVYARLARQAGFESAVIIRGVEGGIVPSLRQKGRYFEYYDGGDEQERELDPVSLGITADTRAVPVPEDLPKADQADALAAGVDLQAFSKVAAESGLAALDGQKNTSRECLAFAGAIVLKHLNKAETLEAGTDMIRAVLDNGSAMARFKAASN